MLPILTPSQFVALVNQTLEFAYPLVEIEGEVSNFKISKNRWVYFDIQDDGAKIRCFGTVYLLPAPVEDGMAVRIISAPRLHPQFGFSLNLQSMQFSGEGTIKKAADLLAAKLEREGLFSAERKRTLPYPPKTVALVASSESAGYKDFIKVLGQRFGGITIELADVQVQGEAAIGQITRAIEWFNRQADLADVLVITRGGGSADDLQVFSSEQVTRAVAASRIPTLVAIGHEVDVSLAELAADLRASTPSNAAELLVPDKKELLISINSTRQEAGRLLSAAITTRQKEFSTNAKDLSLLMARLLNRESDSIKQSARVLDLVNPLQVLKRGYGVVRKEGKTVRSVVGIKHGERLDIMLSDGTLQTEVQ